ncbi:MAG TPA: hypothetical protein VH916_10615 [Dehalococcoidia bacterium]
MLNRRAFLAVAVSGAAAAVAATLTERISTAPRPAQAHQPPRRETVPAIANLAPLSQAGAALAQRARADTQLVRAFDPYLYRVTGERADPINVLFRGDLVATTAAVQQVLGWYPVEGSAMIFRDGSGAHATAVQLGFDLPHASRYHIRLGAVEQQGGQDYVLAGVHRDDTMTCGHVGLAFDEVRDLVVTTFAQAGYATSRLGLDNTQPGPQCDGRSTAGDGTAVIIDLVN